MGVDLQDGAEAALGQPFESTRAVLDEPLAQGRAQLLQATVLEEEVRNAMRGRELEGEGKEFLASFGVDGNLELLQEVAEYANVSGARCPLEEILVGPHAALDEVDDNFEPAFGDRNGKEVRGYLGKLVDGAAIEDSPQRRELGRSSDRVEGSMVRELHQGAQHQCAGLVLGDEFEGLDAPEVDRGTREEAGGREIESARQREPLENAELVRVDSSGSKFDERDSRTILFQC